MLVPIKFQAQLISNQIKEYNIINGGYRIEIYHVRVINVQIFVY
jgi:hypothetical protein